MFSIVINGELQGRVKGACDRERSCLPTFFSSLGVTSYYSSRFLSLSASKAVVLPSSCLLRRSLAQLAPPAKIVVVINHGRRCVYCYNDGIHASDMGIYILRKMLLLVLRTKTEEEQQPFFFFRSVQNLQQEQNDLIHGLGLDLARWICAEVDVGGHTAEMLNLLSVLHTDSFTPRLYIAAATDNMSLQKARLFENSVIDKEFRMAALKCKLSRVSATLLYKILFTAVPSGSNCCYVSIVAFQTDSAFLSVLDCIVLSIHASALFWLSSNVAATALLD
ncbi:hypothetical protein C3L33_15618, partial [Rhododendron williamsianum]